MCNGAFHGKRCSFHELILQEISTDEIIRNLDHHGVPYTGEPRAPWSKQTSSAKFNRPMTSNRSILDPHRRPVERLEVHEVRPCAHVARAPSQTNTPKPLRETAAVWLSSTTPKLPHKTFCSNRSKLSNYPGNIRLMERIMVQMWYILWSLFVERTWVQGQLL